MTLVLVLLFAQVAFGAGFAGAGGRNKTGTLFEIHEGGGDSYILYVEPSGQLNPSSKHYVLGTCSFRYHEHSISCLPDGSSPLAGMTFEIVTRKVDPAKNSCGDDFATFYVCQKGCGADTPKEFVEYPWEC